MISEHILELATTIMKNYEKLFGPKMENPELLRRAQLFPSQNSKWMENHYSISRKRLQI